MRNVQFWSAIRVVSLLVLALGFEGAGNALAAAPASRPAAGMPGVEAILNRTARILDQVSSLTADQKKQIDDILSEARGQAGQMRQELAGLDPSQRATQVRDFLEGVRRDIAGVLTPQQRQEILKKLGGGRASSATTRPGTAARPGEYFERFTQRMRAALAKLDLTAEQKTRVRSLLDGVKVKADQIRAEARDDAGGARDKTRDLLRETRQSLMEILTPDQQETLRDEMRANERNNPRGNSAGSGPRQPGARERAGAEKDGPAPVDQAMAASAGPAVGDAAPAISLATLDGHRLTTSALKGRVAVIIFGSYSSPSFRQRAADIEKLSNDYGIRAHVYVIYTREAHAAGQWNVDRNKDADISLDQPASSAQRENLARMARTKLKLTVPIAIDTMDDAAAKAFGAGENSAFVIGRDGQIVARREWFEPFALRRKIDQAVAKVNPSAQPVPAPVAAP